MMFMVVLVGCIGAYYQRGAVASAAVISYMVGGGQFFFFGSEVLV